MVAIVTQDGSRHLKSEGEAGSRMGKEVRGVGREEVGVESRKSGSGEAGVGRWEWKSGSGKVRVGRLKLGGEWGREEWGVMRREKGGRS